MEDNANKLSPEEKQNLFEQVVKDIDNWKKQRRIRLYIAASAAACIAVLMTIFYTSLFVHHDNEKSPLVATYDNAGNTTDIQLILADNKTISVKNDADISYDKQGEIIVNTANEQIKANKTKSEETSLNALIIPKGKRSNLTLSDGTKIWINAGSKLTFPATFKADKREIWVDGEIYIEVKKDEIRPFLVNTAHMQIEVTGTIFNVTAYNEDAEQSVVLVEGGVNVNLENENIPLTPSHMLSVKGNNISTKKINVYDYISWKDGLLQFTSEPLANILTRLSRYYNIPIVYNDNVKDLKCYGKLVLFDNVEEVMETIYNTVPITYSINDEQITIQKR